SYLVAIFGVLGIVWRMLDCSPVPMMLGFVLGPMVEENLRRALQVSRGDPSVFATRPISLGFIVARIVILIVMAAPGGAKEGGAAAGGLSRYHASVKNPTAAALAAWPSAWVRCLPPPF